MRPASRRQNPLALRIGRALKQTREGRGLTPGQAASEIGISPAMYGLFEYGGGLPNPEIAERLCHWALRGIRYTGAQLTGAPVRLDRAKNWTKFVIKFPKHLNSKIRVAAKEAGLSVKAFIAYCLERSVEDKAMLLDLARNVDAIERALAGELLSECPELSLLLKAETKHLVEAGKDGKMWHEALLTSNRPGNEKLAELSKFKFEDYETKIEDL